MYTFENNTRCVHKYTVSLKKIKSSRRRRTNKAGRSRWPAIVFGAFFFVIPTGDKKKRHRRNGKIIVAETVGEFSSVTINYVCICARVRTRQNFGIDKFHYYFWRERQRRAG